MGKRAFTLIELLVVIAIIAILAAILFPVFVRAKTQAYATTCKSNMRQIATAFTMYADDWYGCYPDQISGLDLTSAQFNAKYPGNYQDSYGGDWNYLYAHRYRNAVGGPGGMSVALMRYLKSYSVFRCKSQYMVDNTFPSSKPDIKGPKSQASSYYYKLALMIYAFNKRMPVSMSTITFPSRVSMLYEYGWHGQYNDPQGCITSGINDGPSKYFNAIFMDGHVGRVCIYKSDGKNGGNYDSNWYFGNSHSANNWDVSKGAFDRLQ